MDMDLLCDENQHVSGLMNGPDQQTHKVNKITSPSPYSLSSSSSSSSSSSISNSMIKSALSTGSASVRSRDTGITESSPQRHAQFLQPVEPSLQRLHRPPAAFSHHLSGMMEPPLSPMDLLQSPSSRYLSAPSTSTPMSFSPMSPLSPGYVLNMMRSNCARGHHLLESGTPSFFCGDLCLSPFSAPPLPPGTSSSQYHPMMGGQYPMAVAPTSSSSTTCSSDSISDLLGSPFTISTPSSSAISTPSRLFGSTPSYTLDSFKDLELSSSKNEDLFRPQSPNLPIVGPSATCSATTTTTTQTRWAHEVQFKWPQPPPPPSSFLMPPPSITVIPDAPMSQIRLSEPPQMPPSLSPKFKQEEDEGSRLDHRHHFMSPMPSHPATAMTPMECTEDQDDVPRPMNAFILFCNDMKAQTQREFPRVTNNEFARILSRKWMSLLPQQKQRYINEAESIQRGGVPPYALPNLSGSGGVVASSSSDAVDCITTDVKGMSAVEMGGVPTATTSAASTTTAANLKRASASANSKGKRKSSGHSSKHAADLASSSTPSSSSGKKKSPIPLGALPPSLLSATTSKLSTVNRTPDGQRIRRPMNAFILFSNDMRPKLAEEHPTIPNKDISKLIGDKWKLMTEQEKQPYLERATTIREKFNKEHPDFKYSNCPKALRTYLKLNARQLSALFNQQLQPHSDGNSPDPCSTSEGAVPAKRRKLENPSSSGARESENDEVMCEPGDVIVRLVVELVNQKKLTPEDQRVILDLVLRHDPGIMAIYNECVLSSKECTIEYFCARIHGLVCSSQQPPQHPQTSTSATPLPQQQQLQVSSTYPPM